MSWRVRQRANARRQLQKHGRWASTPKQPAANQPVADRTRQYTAIHERSVAMDISIITASIGSFVLSERVIKVSTSYTITDTRQHVFVAWFTRFDSFIKFSHLHVFAPLALSAVCCLFLPPPQSSLLSLILIILCCAHYHLLPTQQAKAWVLAVLGTVVAYDLTQTSEDPWSLRVYRGEEDDRRFT